MLVLGIDPSVKTGLILLRHEQDQLNLVQEKQLKTKLRGFDLGEMVAETVLGWVKQFSPDLVTIESYAMHGTQIVQAVELGTIIRFFMSRTGISYLDVPPTSLKKFVTGKGNAKKDLVIKEVFKRFDYDTDTDDLADAYGLAALGLAFSGLNLGLPKVHTEGLSKLSITEAKTG